MRYRTEEFWSAIEPCRRDAACDFPLSYQGNAMAAAPLQMRPLAPSGAAADDRTEVQIHLRRRLQSVERSGPPRHTDSTRSAEPAAGPGRARLAGVLNDRGDRLAALPRDRRPRRRPVATCHRVPTCKLYGSWRPRFWTRTPTSGLPGEGEEKSIPGMRKKSRARCPTIAGNNVDRTFRETGVCREFRQFEAASGKRLQRA